MIDHQVFEVKSTSGDMQLGGQDFDNNLVKYFAPQVTEKCNGADIMQNPKALKKLRDECQKLKHALSHSVEVGCITFCLEFNDNWFVLMEGFY